MFWWHEFNIEGMRGMRMLFCSRAGNGLAYAADLCRRKKDHPLSMFVADGEILFKPFDKGPRRQDNPWRTL